MQIMMIPFVLAGIIIFTGSVLAYRVIRIPAEKTKASELTLLVSEGLSSFSRRTISIIFQNIIYLIVILMLLSFVVKTQINWQQILAFFIGASVMTLITFFSLRIASQFVPKILKNAKGYLSSCLDIVYDASQAIGFLIVGSILFIMLGCYTFLGIESIIGYGLGIMITAFFLRIGGGIYKSSAKITSSIIEKVQDNIPKDHRNPAIILDIIGGYIGEMIGFTSDILSSFMFAVIACIMTVFSLKRNGIVMSEVAEKMFQLPIYIIAASLITALLVYLYGKFRLKVNCKNLLLEKIYLSILLNGIAAFVITKFLNIEITMHKLLGVSNIFHPFYAYLSGAIGAILIALTSEYFANSRFRPAAKIAKDAEYGSILVFLNSLAGSLQSNGIYMALLLIIALPAYYFSGIFGVAIASLGMLSTISSLVSSKVFSSLASNISKVCSLITEDINVQKNANKIDDIGYTTRAIGNGFSVGASTFSTFSLLFALMGLIKIDFAALLSLDIMLLVGIITGIILSFLFTGFLVRGLGQNIILSTKEVARQFAQIPYLREGKAQPDIIKASNYHTMYSLRTLTISGILLVAVPILCGFLFGVKMLFGLVLGSFLISISQGFYWANFGDSISNVYRLIKSGRYGGINTPTYENIVIADNLGSAFNDALAPSINIFIKSVSIIAILVIMILIA